MGKSVISIIGLAATAAGFVLNLVSGWVGDKKMEMAVEEKVNEVLAERENANEQEIES